MSRDKSDHKKEFINNHQFIAVGSDDRVEPVLGSTPQECAEKAEEAMELDSRASELSNWEKRHKDTRVDGYIHWRWRNGDTRWFDYVSIHSVDPETGLGGTS